MPFSVRHAIPSVKIQLGRGHYPELRQRHVEAGVASQLRQRHDPVIPCPTCKRNRILPLDHRQRLNQVDKRSVARIVLPAGGIELIEHRARNRELLERLLYIRSFDGEDPARDGDDTEAWQPREQDWGV